MSKSIGFIVVLQLTSFPITVEFPNCLSRPTNSPKPKKIQFISYKTKEKKANIYFSEAGTS